MPSPNVTSIVLRCRSGAGLLHICRTGREMVELTVDVNLPVCYDVLLQRVLGCRQTLDPSSKVVIVVCGGNDTSLEMLMGWRRATLGEENMAQSTINAMPVPGPTQIAA